MMGKRYELKKGDKFGRLTILGENKLNKYKNVLEKCICECGKERWATHYELTKGIVKVVVVYLQILREPNRERTVGNIDYGLEKIGLAVYINEEEDVKIRMIRRIHNTEADE